MRPEPPEWAPLQLGPVFHGNRLVVYGFAAQCRQAILRANLGGKQVETSVFCSDLSVTKGITLGRLTAKALIRDSLEGHLEGDPIQDELKRRERKPKVIEMSKKYCIVTQVAYQYNTQDTLLVSNSNIFSKLNIVEPDIFLHRFFLLQSKSGYFDIGFFCPIVFFGRQVSVKIVIFVIQLENNRIYLYIGLLCRFGSAIKWTK